MKVFVEVTFQCETEPKCFEAVAEQERKVYIWADKRALLKDNAPLEVFERGSQFVEEPSISGCMEVWLQASEEVPPNPDDVWTEQVKTVERNQITQEWFPQEHLIRLSWVQAPSSLAQRKILPAALQQLQELSLELPPLPSLLLH